MMTNHTPQLWAMLEASKEMNGKDKRDNGLQNDAEFQTQTQPPGLHGHFPGHFGLRNQGATCYLNSVLQVLSMTTEIHDRLDPESQTMDGELRNLFRNLTETTGRTENITGCLEIKNVHQLRNAAECLEMILRKVSPKASEVFQGQLKYTTKCCRGHSINEETNPFWTLPLSLKDAHDTTYSVEENLERIFHTKSFTGDNMVFCNECERKTDATSGCEMVEAPHVLIILLKRFDFDYNTRSHFKSDRRVDVPFALRMKKKKYKLYGTVNHMGGLGGGHYTANILSSEDNTWYECDDTQVTKVGGQPFENHIYSSSTAYLLMYRATECQTPTETKPGDEVKEQQIEGAESLKNDKPVRETNQEANETTDLDCSGCDGAQEDGTRSSITGQNSESEDRTARGDSKGMSSPKQLWNKMKAVFEPKPKPKKDAVTECQTPTETKPGDEVKEQQGEGLKQVKRGAKHKAKANKGTSDDEGNTNKEDEGQMKGETLGPQEARGEEGDAESVRNDKPVRETSQDANETTHVNCASLSLQNDAEFQTQTQPPGLHGHFPGHFGLRNQGATCYLNSVLQVLSMTTEIHDRLDPESQTMDGELRNLFRNLMETTGRTENITGCLEIKNVHQQRDAAECLEMILRKVSPKASEVFQGQLKYTTKCCRGHSINEETNPFWTLPLSLKDAHDTTYSVEENLERIFHTKLFTGDNMVFCNECERKTDATSGCEMVEAPHVLIILLKRFDFDYNTRSHFKSDRRVDVPFTLRMKKKKYKLYGTVNHMGGLRGGHYTANILSSEDNTWYKCNDTQVTKVGGQPFENHIYSSSTAYLLMYRATECQTPTETKPGDEVKEQQIEGAESVKNDKPVRKTSQEANETTDLDCSGCDGAQEDGTRSSITGQNSESEDRTAGGDSKGMSSPKQLWNKVKAVFEPKPKPKKDAGDEVKEQQGEGLKQVKRGAKRKAKDNKGTSDDEGNTNKEDEGQMKGETLGLQEARGEEGDAESVRNDKPVRETSQDANETTHVNCASLSEAKGSSGCEKAPEIETQSYITLESSEPELLTETAM